ncbi:MAG: imidazole glycerol phosphate synthase subunit HisH [Acidimicrobiales bacterium]|nr:imidazole glycerol phosphate synthase subunit HisH [Acidimicrobiales bacterium]
MLAVLDYGIGNLRSAQKGLQKAGADAQLTADLDLIAAADAVVLPGVGAFGRCMEELHSTGLASVAIEAADSGRPFLGICVGMQLMCAGSEESPGMPGLGIFDVPVELLPPGLKRPQMQWNPVTATGPSVLLDGLDGDWFYFVHSYAVAPNPDIVGVCDYGGPVSAVIERGNVMATQFHPEKSGAAGLRLLQNFVAHVASSVPEGAA